MKQCLIVLFLFSAASYTQEVGARYLIITHDNFYNAIQPLAEWKHRAGLRTKVVKLSQIGSTSSQIKDYVQNAYDTWQVTPEFLLLVGAPNYVPWGSYYWDNYYTNMDSDIFNEILSGRLTVHDATEAQAVVNKILLYEKTPDVTDTLWFTDACLIVREDYYTYPPPPYGDDSIYWSDIRYAKGLMLASCYNTIDTLSKLLGNSASTVMNRVNQGRAFVLYRGSGTNNWYYPFSVNPTQLQNDAKLPIVLSLTCGTIGTGSSPATAERWLLTGTPTLPKGAAGYFATTTSGSNIAHLRSAVCKGFFGGLFQQSKTTFGEACEAGRVNVYNLYNSSSEYRGFTTLGDPAMNIWTALPKPLGVMCDSLLSTRDDSLTVQVLFQDVPFESALVCVLFDTLVYGYGYTAVDGRIVLALRGLEPGFLQITVTAQNKIPYIDSIPIVDTRIEEATEPTPVNVRAITVHPNPFSDQTQIRFVVRDPQYTEQELRNSNVEMRKYALNIYDAAGRLVRSFHLESGIIDDESMIRWDGYDSDGNRLPAGVYFVQTLISEEKHTMPVLLVR
jgi:hypothetical protein